MKNTLLLTGAMVASTLSSQAAIVFFEDFDPAVTVVTSNGANTFDGASGGSAGICDWWASNNGVAASVGSLDFSQDSANRTRGAGVWLNTTGWDHGTVTVTIDIANFVAGAGPLSGAFVQTYSANGVDASNTVGIDVHGNFNGGVVLSQTGTASIATLGTTTQITGIGTSIAHTFTYSGEEEIAIGFLNLGQNDADSLGYINQAFDLSNLAVNAETFGAIPEPGTFGLLA